MKQIVITRTENKVTFETISENDDRGFDKKYTRYTTNLSNRDKKALVQFVTEEVFKLKYVMCILIHRLLTRMRLVECIDANLDPQRDMVYRWLKYKVHLMRSRKRRRRPMRGLYIKNVSDCSTVIINREEV